jgi:hypothetical protein
MPTFYSQSSAGIESAIAKSYFSYQMVDLVAARAFLTTEQITFNYSIGGTGGYVKEDFDVIYGAPNNTYVHNKWTYACGGFRTTLDSNWHMGYGFGVFGRFSFAALLGQYRNHNEITADGPLIGSGIPNRLANTFYHGILLVPATQIALGFDWMRSFTNCRVSAIRFAVTGEFNNLANLHQVYKTVQPPASATIGKQLTRDVSSVYLYGADIRLGIDY